MTLDFGRQPRRIGPSQAVAQVVVHIRDEGDACFVKGQQVLASAPTFHASINTSRLCADLLPHSVLRQILPCYGHR
jgi:hypothetical protein